MNTTKASTGIVIPYYNASAFIETVVNKALVYSSHVVVVNDQSPEPLPEAIKSMQNVTVLICEKNLGVGGATKKGFAYFAKQEAIKVVVKIDADDQMDTGYIPSLIAPILNGTHQFVKGNRFRDFKALKKMPFVRRYGNLLLSFLSKMATGYWNCFDFNNGYFAISKENLKTIHYDAVANNYFFETSLIAELYFDKAAIHEIAMPAIYGEESSNMRIYKMPFLFLKNLCKKWIQRLWKSYFVYDFNMGSVYLFFGFPLFLGGIIFGGINWYSNVQEGVLTPLGTIMISTLLIILGFQLLLQAIQFDIWMTPKSKEHV